MKVFFLNNFDVLFQYDYFPRTLAKFGSCIVKHQPTNY